jgi:carbamoyltransferase
MSFAVYAKQKAIEETPSIVHVDNTCRIQTVTKEQNKNYYTLILEFYKKTNIPILLNTSYNLAGCPVVEELENAIDIANNSQFKYIYNPDYI